MGFYGRVAVITGAGSGIGQALALELARRGADLALSDIDEAGLEETVRRVGSGRKVSARRFDVADRAAFLAYADEVIAEHGKVDAIVNNAGVSLSESVAEMTWEDWDWLLSINLGGVVNGTKAFLPHLIARDDGWVVNVSSVFGIIAVPNQSAYNAAKFAVRGFTEALRQELHDTGVTASCVHPGGIKTNIVRNGRYGRQHGVERTKDEAIDEFERIARTTPERAAIVIADGMEQRAPRILIGTDAEIIDRVQRVAPVRYTALLRKLVERAGRARS